MVLLFAVNLLRPPFVAARAALMPEVLGGDGYPVANGVDNNCAQVVQVVGYAVGGSLVALLSLRGALLVDAGPFLLSALLIMIGVRRRPAPRPAVSPARPGRAAGLRVFWSDPRLRAYVLVLWTASAFTYAAEGLIAPLPSQYGGGAGTVGLLLAAAPTGMAVGGIALTRLCPPATRARLILPLAVLAAGVLAAVWLVPPLWVVLSLLVSAGAASAFAIPLNALFGRAVPARYRGRAFGVAITGLSGFQGMAMVIAGMAADRWAATTIIGFSGLCGESSLSYRCGGCVRAGDDRGVGRTSSNDLDRWQLCRGGRRRPTLSSPGGHGAAPSEGRNAVCSVGKRGVSWPPRRAASSRDVPPDPPSSPEEIDGADGRRCGDR
ncbi:MFS transporter [Micromonospora sp. NPDC023737]|uniref:MFS transporter n=1 Tax=unclassified Micromonospora TaxID=2617518 RepID=UPI0033D8041C